MYTYKNLLWTKNVTRNGGKDWAYIEYNDGESFFLNWSPQWKGNVLKAKPGEIILLFQTIKGLPDKSKNGTYLTHLVTPIDNVLREDNLSVGHPFGRFVGLISKAKVPRLKPSELSFQEPNRGAVCSLDTIKIKAKLGSDISLLAKQKTFWKFFPKSDFSIDSVFNFLPSILDADEDTSATEGELKYRIALHKYYERDPELIKAAKAKAMREDRFFCEACTFDFAKVYPGLGFGFIECHHRHPIAKAGIRENSIEDLALVCSNCHRMLHRRFDDMFLTVEQLKSRFFN